MSKENLNNEENDLFANNKGVIKSWKGLVLAIVGVGGFIGYLALLVLLSLTPSLKWLVPALVGLLFFVVGIVFLKLSKTNYTLPLFAVLIGAVLMYFCISEKFFPGFIDAVGDKGVAVIIIAFGIIILLYPFAVKAYYKHKYKVPVEATVIDVDYHYSRDGHGNHVRVYRSTYEYTFSGKVYQVADKIYSSGSHPAEGEVRDFLIDAKKPEHFFDVERMGHRSLSSYIFSVILLALGIYLFVA